MSADLKHLSLVGSHETVNDMAREMSGYTFSVAENGPFAFGISIKIDNQMPRGDLVLRLEVKC